MSTDHNPLVGMDVNGDVETDLCYVGGVNGGVTGTGHVELHCLDGATDYETDLLATGTPWGYMSTDHYPVLTEMATPKSSSPVDATEPTANLVTPPAGAVYALHQSVAADFSCADEPGGSGIDTCVGTVADGSPIDTSTLGSHQFSVTATDVAGNTKVVNRSYTVANARPDGRIKRGATGTYVGNNVYNTTGTNQTSTGSAAPGSTVTYFASIQNDARFSDTLRLRGTTSNSSFTVRYLLGTTDITAQVTAGTYTTGALALGAARLITIVVKVKSSAPSGSSLAASLLSKSDTDSTRRDTVKFVTSRT